MANKQLSEFEKGQIVVYNDCGLSLRDIAKKFNHRHSLDDIFQSNYQKIGKYRQKREWKQQRNHRNWRYENYSGSKVAADGNITTTQR